MDFKYFEICLRKSDIAVLNYNIPSNLKYKSFFTLTMVGISVDWLSNLVYWADKELNHIMCAQLDGRFHQIILENINYPRGLAVDPVHG